MNIDLFQVPNLSRICLLTNEEMDDLQSTWSLCQVRVLSMYGSKMRSMENLMSHFADTFAFPACFGRNGNALRDCLTDMSWMECRGFLVLFRESEDILGNCPSKCDWLECLLQDILSSWACPIEVGEWWDRPSIPFRSVVEVSATTHSNDWEKLSTVELADLFLRRRG